MRDGSRRAPARRWRPSPSSAGRLGATRLTPVVTALIVINVAIYLVERANPSVITRFALWAAGVHSGQWYRLITAAFLHASVEHVAFNMITLAIVGPPVEAELGRVRFAALYLLAALGGSIGSYLLSKPDQLGVGASGAIFGVMGAYFVLARRHGWETRTITALIVINLVIGFTQPAIDWRAHLGGLVTGAAVGLGLARTAESRRHVAGVAVSLVAVAVLAALAQLPPGQVNL